MSTFDLSFSPPPAPLIPGDGNFSAFQSTKLYLIPDTVTQITSATTPVSINSYTGTITTTTFTTGALGTTNFTVNNSAVSSNSVVIAKITNYSGTYVTNGLPTVNVQTVAEGSFILSVSNLHTGNALAGVLKISFTIV